MAKTYCGDVVAARQQTCGKSSFPHFRKNFKCRNYNLKKKERVDKVAIERVEVKDLVERLPCLQSNEQLFLTTQVNSEKLFLFMLASKVIFITIEGVSIPLFSLSLCRGHLQSCTWSPPPPAESWSQNPDIATTPPSSQLPSTPSVRASPSRERSEGRLLFCPRPRTRPLEAAELYLWIVKLCDRSPCSGGKCCRTACLSSATAGRVIVAQIHTFHTFCLSYFTPGILTRSSLRVWGAPCDLSHRGPWWTAANPPPTLVRCSGSPRSRGSTACPGERSEMTWRRKVPHRLKSLTASTCSGISLYHTQKSVEALLRSIPEHLPAATLKRDPTSPQRLAQESWRSSPSLRPATPGVHFFIFLSLNVP